MKEITYYMEFTGNPENKSLKDFTGFRSPIKNDILDYFKNHGVFQAVMAHAATDYITGEMLKSSVQLFSDGVYRWTNEEIYHFEKYDIKLNDDFIRYISEKI